MEIKEVLLKFFLVIVCAGIIGYEREIHESNVGVKTHIIVGIGAVLVALMQLEIMNVILNTPELANNPGLIRTDPARMAAQVISGIGFLGAGAIVTTKTKISGLTTAASIWSVAIISLTIGFGFYKIAMLGFLIIITTLFVFKNLFVIETPTRIIIRFLKSEAISQEITETFAKLNIEVELLSFNYEAVGDNIIEVNTYKLIKDAISFEELVKELTKIPDIVSVEKTNIQQ